MGIYLRLLTYLKPLKFHFLLSIFGFAVFAASQPLLAKLMELIIEAIEINNADARWSLPLYAVGIFLIRGVGWFLGNYFNAFVGASLIRNLKGEVFQHLTLLPAKFYGKNSQGQLLHRLNSGVERVRETVTTALKKLISEGLTVIALLGYVFYLNWQLSLIFLFVAPLLFLMVTYSAKRFRDISRKSEGALGKAMQVSKELISNYSIVRGFGAEDYETRRYEKALGQAFKMQMKVRKVESIVTPVSQLVIAVAVALVVFMLLQPATLATNTTGDLIGYLTAIALLPKPIRQLSGLNIIIQRGLIGAEQVFSLLDTEAENDKGDHEAQVVNGQLNFNDVSFVYPDTDKPALKGLSFNIKEGETVALVGKSGSGKSTLVSLIYRAYDLESGFIALDGMPLEKYKLKNLRKHIAKVDQNIALFDDTIRNNIAYGDLAYSDDQIWAALDNAYASSFIRQLPDGLDTSVGENGIKLSGGQRQRLAIARAFLKDATILILDEATSALDNESEAMVKDALSKVMKDRTTIVIAHRLSTVERADRILVMEEGELVEQGAYKELLERDGRFSRLHQASFS
jgi:subfamily B ATP-binding cassette protein MsbA